MDIKEKYRNIAVQSFCLGKILNERKISQATFSEMLEGIGVKKSKVIISQFVTGKALPSLESLAAFSEVLNIPIWQFLVPSSTEGAIQTDGSTIVESDGEISINCPHCQQKIYIGLKTHK